ncbi:LysR substrate-binding domain-containing protein [Kitasatospora sp. RB6PN24]|uniref:LysR substrate-binding domain-containing protein n=1 Tax=Kitasatospora humi TaxID=2893891 RepID=UPI001E3932BC|nr:LysR substrate-binding domain-containing protein [Kitasatospora humi]MCC9309506.1 LysR substrate-binding domain-containing protein [Kitasatospora humi]
MTENQATSSFRLAYVPGVTPSKWIRIWEQRLPEVPLTLLPVAAAGAEQVLTAGTADVALLRLPVDRTVLSAIPLYTETTVVVMPKDHELTEDEELLVEQLADEVIWHPQDETIHWETRPGQPGFERPVTTGDAIELVAARVGLLVVPQSLARLHHRRDLTYRPLVDAPQSQVALSWPEQRTTDLVEEFIGIVRGRTVNSSRGRTAAAAEAKPQVRKDRKTAAAPARKPGPKPAARSSRGGAAAAKRGKPRRRG